MYHYKIRKKHPCSESLFNPHVEEASVRFVFQAAGPFNQMYRKICGSLYRRQIRRREARVH